MSHVKFNRTIKGRIFLLIFFVFIVAVSFSQEHNSDSIYKKIKNVADKSKFATLIYNAVFVEPKPEEYPSKPVSKEEKIVNPYLKYENRIIRKIVVKVYDPFGHSIKDTIEPKNNFFQRAGNSLHVSSRQWIIINKLLFKENEPLIPLSLSESERLLRQTIYVNDARIFISDVENSDNVDVYVIVQDKWTVNMPVVISDITSYLRFRNENLFGTGNQFEQYVGLTRPDMMDYSGYYNLSNIDNTYISSRIYYETNKDVTSVGLAFDRPFFSPLTKWAGGASYKKTWRYYAYTDSVNGVIKQLRLDNSVYDIWVGRSIKINSKKRFFNQSTNVIYGVRYYTNKFDKRPSFTIDAQKTNSNASAFIGNVGFAVQQFYKDKFIYRFGANEDVPHGLIVQFLYGVTENEFSASKYYLGAEIARAKHFKFGYLSATVSCGMFFSKSIQNDITSSFKVNYFSDLFRMGKWYLREFANVNFVSGINKATSGKIVFSSDELYGFNSGSLDGNSKMVLNLETVAYAPYNLIGFRLAPTALIGMGMIGDKQNKLMKSNLYQAYALGLMVRNENLLSSTFQVTYGLYPFLPSGENYVFKYNPVTSFTLRVKLFVVTRPEFISY